MSDDKKHALLSPSGASRWLKCPPSARLEYAMPNKTSEAAEEGTVAHRLAEIILNFTLEKTTLEEYKKDLSEIMGNAYYNLEMAEYIDQYVDFVGMSLMQSIETCPDAEIEIEASIPLTYYATEDTGTGDVMILADRVLKIIDLKYGKGVRVECKDNSQMKIYALGALEKYQFMYDIERIEMTIFQPRLENVSTVSMPVAELTEWAINELLPTAALAEKGEGEFATGSHCRFCRVREQCRAYKEENLKVLSYEFRDAALLSDDEIADIISQSSNITGWLKSVEEFAFRKAMAGQTIKGYKLVSGKSSRVYSNPDLVAKRLIEKGYPEAIIYNRELLGITAMEKTLSKKVFTELLSDLLVKPDGKPSLVAESDPRPAINTLENAKNDFTNN